MALQLQGRSSFLHLKLCVLVVVVMVCVFLVKKMSAFGLSSVLLVVCPVDTLY